MLTGRPRLFEPTLTETERRALTAAAHSRTLPYSQVRVAQIILRSAAGEGTTSIAHAFGLAVQTVGPLAPALPPARLGRALRRAPQRAPTHVRRRARGRAAPDGARRAAEGGHALERAHRCCRDRDQQEHGPAVLRPLRRAGAPHAFVQPVHRPAVRRQGARRDRALPQPARQGARALRRREEPDPGARADTARGAGGPRARRGGDAGLRAARHHHALRRPGCGHRLRARPVPAPAPASGVPALSGAQRRERAGRLGRAPRDRQLRDPQARRRARLARGAAPLPHPLHAHVRVLAEPGRAVFRARHPARNPARLRAHDAGAGAPHRGVVRVRGVSSCTNPVLHGWLESQLEAILATLPAPTVLSPAENLAR